MSTQRDQEVWLYPYETLLLAGRSAPDHRAETEGETRTVTEHEADDVIRHAPIWGRIERFTCERLDADTFKICMAVSAAGGPSGKWMEYTWGSNSPLVRVVQETRDGREPRLATHMDLRFQGRDLTELDGAQVQFRLIDAGPHG